MTGCDTVKRFTSKSKEAWTKHFFQADSKISNAFCSYPQEHFTENFEAIKIIVLTPYVPNLIRLRTLQKLGGTYFQKCRRPHKRKVKMEN